MNSYLLSFKDIDNSQLMSVGGKGARTFGKLSKIEGIQVPEGFCSWEVQQWTLLFNAEVNVCTFAI